MRRSPVNRWMAWLAALALLLNGGMPALAASAAQWQGRAVDEVCGVWGVKLPGAVDMGAHAHHAAGHDHGHGGSAAEPGAPQGAHGGQPCALVALAALGGPSTGSVLAAPDLPASAHREHAPRAWPARPDATAAWAAQHKHEPPAAG